VRLVRKEERKDDGFAHLVHELRRAGVVRGEYIAERKGV
jgi:hypothetical protein